MDIIYRYAKNQSPWLILLCIIFCSMLVDHHIIIAVDGIHDNVIKFKPPMCFSLENAEHFLSSLETVLNKTSTWFYHISCTANLTSLHYSCNKIANVHTKWIVYHAPYVSCIIRIDSILCQRIKLYCVPMKLSQVMSCSWSLVLCGGVLRDLHSRSGHNLPNWTAALALLYTHDWKRELGIFIDTRKAGPK